MSQGSHSSSLCAQHCAFWLVHMQSRQIYSPWYIALHSGTLNAALMSAGQARIFGCLQENVAKAGFGEGCRQQVEQRQEKMQDDYRLNYGVASQCGADVDAYCALEKVLQLNPFCPLIYCTATLAQHVLAAHCTCCGQPASVCPPGCEC